LCELLFTYSLAETRQIFETLIQNPRREFPADSDYSKKKGRLLKGLEDRFGDKIRIVTAAHNVRHLECQPDAVQLAGLVDGCLEMFAPWMTRCLPDNVSRSAIVNELWFKGEVDQENQVELQRMHYVIHCLNRFTNLFKLSKPRIAIPRFYLDSTGSGNGGSYGDRQHPPSLTTEERRRIGQELTWEQRRRKLALSRLLDIYVNGRWSATLDLTRQGDIRVQVTEEAQMITVRAGKVMLATVFLPDLETLTDAPGFRQTIKLEGGQEVTCSVAVATDSENEVASVTLHIQHQETNLLRSLARWVQRLAANPIAAAQDLIPASPLAQTAWVVSTALLVVTLAISYNQRASPIRSLRKTSVWSRRVYPVQH
jgi:hypothetical protein